MRWVRQPPYRCVRSKHYSFWAFIVQKTVFIIPKHMDFNFLNFVWVFGVNKYFIKWFLISSLQTSELPEISFDRLSPKYKLPIVGTTGSFLMRANFQPNYSYKQLNINLLISGGNLVEVKLVHTGTCLRMVNLITLDQQSTRYAASHRTSLSLNVLWIASNENYRCRFLVINTAFLYRMFIMTVYANVTTRKSTFSSSFIFKIRLRSK